MIIQSAGFIIVDFSGLEPKALCLMNNFYQWDFPKGQLEKGESSLDAAFRETEEESGLGPNDFQPSGIKVSTPPYKIPQGTKVATYFFAERMSKTQPYLPINPKLGHAEHIALKWISVYDLHKLVSRRLRPVVDELVKWCDDLREVQD